MDALEESCPVRALVVEIRRICPKLTPRLCRSDGRMLAMTGGLLGKSELVIELRDIEERGKDGLLLPERGRLDVDCADVRRLFCCNISNLVVCGCRSLWPWVVRRVLVVPLRWTCTLRYSPLASSMGSLEARYGS